MKKEGAPFRGGPHRATRERHRTHTRRALGHRRHGARALERAGRPSSPSLIAFSSSRLETPMRDGDVRPEGWSIQLYKYSSEFLYQTMRWRGPCCYFMLRHPPTTRRVRKSALRKLAKTSSGPMTDDGGAGGQEDHARRHRRDAAASRKAWQRCISTRFMVHRVVSAWQGSVGTV